MAFDLDDNEEGFDTLGSIGLGVEGWVSPDTGHGSGGSQYYEPILTPIETGSYGSGGGSIGNGSPVDPYLGPPQQANENEPLPNSQPATSGITPATAGTAGTIARFDGNTILIGLAIVAGAVILLSGGKR